MYSIKLAYFRKREKKGGNGARNWGSKNVNEDFEKLEKENQESTTDEEEDNKNDNTLTFDEYLEKNGQANIHQQLNETKVKVTEGQLLEEVGKATQLQSRKERSIDDYAETSSKKLHKTHNIKMKAEYAGLLGKSNRI